MRPVYQGRKRVERNKSQMDNHYISIEPGERVFILHSTLAGDNDNTYVLELKLPTTSFYGELSYDHKPPEVAVYDILELNECFNLTVDGSDLLSAYK
jgi:hypothetical protein